MLNDRVSATQAKDFGVKSGETNTTSKFVNENIRSDKYINKSKNIKKSMINIADLSELNIDEANKESNETEFSVVKRKKDTTNKRNITLIGDGDSMIKNIEAHEIRRCVKPNEKIYVKSYSGAKIADIRGHAKPSQRYEPDLTILHMGTNDLRTSKIEEEISDEIIKLTLEMKTDGNEIIVRGIIRRNDEYNEKGMKVNDLLQVKCGMYALGFMKNYNISVKKHVNGGGLHLNYNGTKALANNFLKAINV